MTLLIFLLVLSFLVIIHELGHFLTAIWMKVRVEEFGVGFPPRLATLFKWRGIPFTLNALPFGGFVKMDGEDEPESDSKKAKSKNEVGPFYSKSKRARLLILLAGVTINFVFGVLAFATIYTVMGIPEPSTLPKIDYVAEGSPAQTAGIQASDVFTAVIEQQEDGSQVRQEFSSSQEFIDHINSRLGQSVTIELQRNEEVITVNSYARPPEERSAEEGAMGVSFQNVEFVFYPGWQRPFRGMWVGIQQSIALSVMILKAFGDMITQIFTQARFPEGVAGPVGIVHQAGKLGLFQQGFLTILNFAGMLSINLAILNALPLPAFDGGRAVMVLLETVIGKKTRAQIENKLNYVGVALLIGLMILITLNDVSVIVTDWWK